MKINYTIFILFCIWASAPRLSLSGTSFAEVTPSGVTAENPQGKIISEVLMQIPENISTAQIQEKLYALKKTPFDSQKINLLLKEIYLSKNFHNVHLHTFLKDDRTLKLSFIFEAAKRIKEIEFSGNELFSDIQLLRSIETTEESIFNEDLLQKDTRAILAMYQDMGYFQTKIELQFFSPEKPNEIKTVFKIIEGGPTKISSLTVESVGRPKSKKIQSWMDISKGDIYTPKKLKGEIFKLKKYFFEKRYLDAKFFPEEISFTPDKSGVHVFLRLAPGPRHFFSFKGNLELDNYALLAPLNQPSEEIIPRVTLQDLTNHMMLQYQNLGFVNAKVNYATLEEKKYNTKSAVFTIQEGLRVKIQDYLFEDIVHFDKDFYLKFIHAAAPEEISNNIYVPKLLQRVPQLIIDELKSRGFLFAKAQIKNINWDSEKTLVTPIISIQEGAQTLIEDVLIHGNIHFKSDFLLSLIEIQKGGPLNLYRLDLEIQKILQHYQKNGYLKCHLKDPNTLIQYSDDFTKAEIKIDLSEGHQITIGNIVIRGVNRTRGRVIEREINLQPGAPWNPQEIQIAEKNLIRLGLFSHVDIHPPSSQFQSGANDVVIDVRERKPGIYEVGGGFKSDDGFHGFTGIAYHNLGGWHRVLSLRGDINRKTQGYKFLEREIQAGLSEPYLGGIPFVMRTNVTHKKEATLPFDIRSWEGKFSLDKNLWNFLSTSFYYSYAYRDIFRAIDTRDIQEKAIASLGTNLFFDFRDDPFNPRWGSSHALSSEFFLPAIGSNEAVDLTRNIVTTSWYITPFSFVTLALLGRGGYAHSFATNDPIPVDQRFYLGGRSTLRGFEEDIIGSETKNKSIFENSFVNYKAELRFHVTKQFGLLAFIDGGNVYFDGPARATTYRHAAGPGLTYQTPVGPLSTSFGFIIDRDRSKDEPVGRFHFSLGLF